MKDFQWIHERAVRLKGSKAKVKALMPEVKTSAQLLQLTDAECLSAISRRVFRAGLKHSMVDAKWPAFEAVFHQFDPIDVLMMSDEALEALMQDARIIRHWGKIKTVRHNALFVSDIAREYGSFSTWIADWPVTEIVDLWVLLKKRGSHLGGRSGAALLRYLEKDTFRMSEDVLVMLKALGVVDKMPSSKKDLQAVQAAFNQWHQESGLPMAHISRMLSFT